VKFGEFISELRSKGIFILTVGEMENFDRDVDRHGQRWVQAVISRGKLGAKAKGAIRQEFHTLAM
jgi:hypothetical protein